MPGPPVTTPPIAVIDALEPLVTVQVPPGVASDKVMVRPVQTVVGPVMGAGRAFTVNSSQVLHPGAAVNV